MRKPKIGLLPLYVELYDRALPDMRGRIDAFHQQIASGLEKLGLDVVTVPACRIREEFERAVRAFENAGADCIVTLHLAYSPSLESEAVLASTRLPIIVLDTTPTYDYSPSQDPDELLYNHGIHGVQDMCNLLIRNGKAFRIEAGHWQKSDVLERVARWASVASIAARLKSARIGLIGGPFQGMGDFAVPFDVLRSTIGIEVVEASPAEIEALVPSDNDRIVDEEISADLQRFSHSNLSENAHRATIRSCIAVRRWIEKENLTGFSANFLTVGKAFGISAFPFLEASKAMARGVGYAGEGDVITAALVGALASAYPATSFTEMFCPDWSSNSIFLSHMGEMNIDLVANRPLLIEKPMPWTDLGSSVVALGCFKPGSATLVNLAPGPENTYTLIIAPVEMLDSVSEDRMTSVARGWFKPHMPIGDFLTEYSYVGGTHHLALVYEADTDEIAGLGGMMGWKVVRL